MSGFKKKEKVEQQQKIFFGQPEVDGILGNNLKAGTLILLEEDHPTSLHLQFQRYFVGCGYHLKEDIFILDVFANRWSTLIPQKFKARKVVQKGSEGAEKEDNVIAWRYNSQQIKLKDLDNFVSKDIPKLDLSKSEDLGGKDGHPELIHSKDINEFSSYKEILGFLGEQYQQSLKDEQDQSVKKILITNLFSCFSKIEDSTINLARFLQTLKVMVRSSNCLLLLTIPYSLSPAIKNLVYLNFDLILKINPIFQKEELEHFHGILNFIKVPAFNSFVNFKLETLAWGIKASSKRKLEIDKLYLIPEGESKEQDTSKKESKLDF